jgi:hypothetical protein
MENMEETQVESEKIWKIWKNCHLNSEMILKIWKKPKLKVKRYGKYGRIAS